MSDQSIMNPEKGCTPFCERPCQYINKHHPVLVGILDSSTKNGFAKFKKELNYLEVENHWDCNDPIPDICPEFNYPILHWAAVLGKTRVLQWCIDQQFDLFKTWGNRSETALHRLVLCGYTAIQTFDNVYQIFEDVIDLLEVLLDARDDNQDLPLHVAAKLLVEKQSDVSTILFKAYTKLTEILAYKTSQMCDGLINACNVDGNTVLHILASSNACCKLVKKIVEFGGVTNIKNNNGLTVYEITMSNKGEEQKGVTKKENKDVVYINLEEEDENSEADTSEEWCHPVCNNNNQRYRQEDAIETEHTTSSSLEQFDSSELSEVMGKPSSYISPYKYKMPITSGKRKAPESIGTISTGKKHQSNKQSVQNNIFSKTRVSAVYELSPTVKISPLKLDGRITQLRQVKKENEPVKANNDCAMLEKQTNNKEIPSFVKGAMIVDNIRQDKLCTGIENIHCGGTNSMVAENTEKILTQDRHLIDEEALVSGKMVDFVSSNNRKESPLQSAIVPNKKEVLPSTETLPFANKDVIESCNVEEKTEQLTELGIVQNKVKSALGNIDKLGTDNTENETTPVAAKLLDNDNQLETDKQHEGCGIEPEIHKKDEGSQSYLLTSLVNQLTTSGLDDNIKVNGRSLRLNDVINSIKKSLSSTVDITETTAAEASDSELVKNQTKLKQGTATEQKEHKTTSSLSSEDQQDQESLVHVAEQQQYLKNLLHSQDESVKRNNNDSSQSTKSWHREENHNNVQPLQEQDQSDLKKQRKIKDNLGTQQSLTTTDNTKTQDVTAGENISHDTEVTNTGHLRDTTREKKVLTPNVKTQTIMNTTTLQQQTSLSEQTLVTDVQHSVNNQQQVQTTTKPLATAEHSQQTLVPQSQHWVTENKQSIQPTLTPVGTNPGQQIAICAPQNKLSHIDIESPAIQETSESLITKVHPNHNIHQSCQSLIQSHNANQHSPQHNLTSQNLSKTCESSATTLARQQRHNMALLKTTEQKSADQVYEQQSGQGNQKVRDNTHIKRPNNNAVIENQQHVVTTQNAFKQNEANMLRLAQHQTTNGNRSTGHQIHLTHIPQNVTAALPIMIATQVPYIPQTVSVQYTPQNGQNETTKPLVTRYRSIAPCRNNQLNSTNNTPLIHPNIMNNFPSASSDNNDKRQDDQTYGILTGLLSKDDLKETVLKTRDKAISNIQALMKKYQAICNIENQQNLQYAANKEKIDQLKQQIARWQMEIKKLEKTVEEISKNTEQVSRFKQQLQAEISSEKKRQIQAEKYLNENTGTTNEQNTTAVSHPTQPTNIGNMQVVNQGSYSNFTTVRFTHFRDQV